MKGKAFLIGVIILSLLGGNSCKKELIVPEELSGVWVTSAPKYEGCYFEVTSDEIIIKDKEEEVNFFEITKIEAEKNPDENFINYIITYVDLGGRPFEMSVLYFPAEEGTIRFKHQKNIVWVRSETD
jgi:hypothetical protein